VEPGKPEEEYRAAVAMIQDSGRNIWVINGSYLVISGFVARPLLEAIDSMSPTRIAIVGILGFFLSILWLASFERNYAFYNLRIRQARRLEDRLGFRVFTDGEVLSKIGLVAPPGIDPVAMSGIGRLGSIQKLARTVILLFGVGFAVAAIVGFCRLIAA
jgi:hypothetical protein